MDSLHSAVVDDTPNSHLKMNVDNHLLTPSTFKISKLSPEIQLEVLRFLLADETPIEWQKQDSEESKHPLFTLQWRPQSRLINTNILATSKWFHREGQKILYGRNQFLLRIDLNAAFAGDYHGLLEPLVLFPEISSFDNISQQRISCASLIRHIIVTPIHDWGGPLYWTVEEVDSFIFQCGLDYNSAQIRLVQELGRCGLNLKTLSLDFGLTRSQSYVTADRKFRARSQACTGPITAEAIVETRNMLRKLAQIEHIVQFEMNDYGSLLHRIVWADLRRPLNVEQVIARGVTDPEKDDGKHQAEVVKWVEAITQKEGRVKFINDVNFDFRDSEKH